VTVREPVTTRMPSASRVRTVARPAAARDNGGLAQQFQFHDGLLGRRLVDRLGGHPSSGSSGHRRRSRPAICSGEKRRRRSSCTIPRSRRSDAVQIALPAATSFAAVDSVCEIYVQSRGALKRELTRYLRTGRAPRTPGADRTDARDEARALWPSGHYRPARERQQIEIGSFSTAKQRPSFRF
jgi:hypothetical protein